ncbi:hypothetical protein GPJ56_004436 [Histomonas meleagridis]|uniref:uncharacterized protein n=1 Tax=Histomonas meleagridis TaxID=135588 RepID=UPI003559E8F0|nr:hypothetical protein GPJ56_004436 [Histomonas meleagridis]KAH0803758.1 hypothetical protein GO595_003445 [Histomonas meleagridis]
MNAVIEEIVQYDAIYRSDGPGYVNFRRHFLKKSEKTLNPKFRANTYLPLRILLYETTRSHAKHSLNDLWLLMHMSRKKNFDLPISTSDIEIIPWHQISAAITVPGPVSDFSFAPSSRDTFAFSTIDGSLHFAIVETLHLKILSHINIPNIVFLKFKWISPSMIVGLGFISSIFAISNQSHLYEITLQSTPSEIEIFNGNTTIVIVGDICGNIYSIDFSEISTTKNDNLIFKQPTTATISNAYIDPVKIFNAKKPITSIRSPKDSNIILCGTSDGDIYIITVELKTSRKWKGQFSELKAKSVQNIKFNKLTKEVKPSSIDSISSVFINSKNYVFVNTRNERAALLCSDDNLKTLHLLKQYRVPSLRAKCPGALNDVNGKWLWAAGTDMGDLIIEEEGEEIVILTMHEAAITVVQWLPGVRAFISADSAGLMSIWTKQVN